MSKTVWIFNHYAGPPARTSGTRHYQFARHLMAMGYTVRVFAASTVHNTGVNLITDGRAFVEMEEQGVPFVYLRARAYEGNGRARLFNMLDYYRGLFKAVKHFAAPDVILASSVHPLTCRAGIKIAKKLGVPCIAEIRDLWPESIVEYSGVSRRNPAIWALYRLEKWIYKKADRVVFTFEGGYDYIRERGWQKDIPAEKVSSINNGVDLAEFEENAAAFPATDADLLDKSHFNVVYTGSIRKVNDVGLLVDVAQELQSAGSCARLLIWGDGDERPEIEARAKALGQGNIALKGRVPKNAVPGLLRAADVCLLHWKDTPIMRFGLSANKLFEYFAAGKPVLSTLHPAYDLVERYGAGITSADQTAQGIARAVMALEGATQAALDAYGEGAALAALDYDFAALTGQLVQLIEGILQSE